MAGIYGFTREAVRVKVKKCEGNLPPEWRKFSVDPQITSVEVLYSILAKAFDLKSDFNISYRTLDPMGEEVFLAVLSDWDLDAAFLRAHNFSISTATEPCLNLKVDIKPFSESSEWDSPTSFTNKETSTLQQSIGVGQKYVQNMQNRLPGLIMNQMEKTFSMVTRALNFVEDQSILQPIRGPLCDSEFRAFLDSVGQIVYPNNLRQVIYEGGIDPSLRRVVWKHILNVYPDGMTGRERMDYMKRKATEYYRLREIWRNAVQHGPVIGELAYVTSMVRKDVLRTDRLHPFYAGNDDNQNIASLFNILTTYALNHPAVSYCQGMSDIASPLLVTMGDEAQAYICFCAVMKRLYPNFLMDGIAMTQKFSHLSEALQFYDPEFFDYLKSQQADDLLFCYRWLLLEMKREFAFEDSLRMLEVLWSSLPPEPPAQELQLYEKEFTPAPAELQPPPKSPSAVVMRTPRENAYTKLCAIRRQSSSQSLIPTSPNALKTIESTSTGKTLDSTKRLNQSLDENITRQKGIQNHTVSKSFQSLDETKLIDHQNSEAKLTVTKQQDSNEKTVKLLEVEKNERNDQLSRSTSPSYRNDSDTSSEVTSPKTCKNSNHIHRHHSLKQHSSHIRRPGGGHFKDLKERLAAGKKGIFASLDKIENFQLSDLASTTSGVDDKIVAKGEKIVKNFNEFLNFTSNRSISSPKLLVTRTKSSGADGTSQKPAFRPAKPSLDDSDSSIAESSSGMSNTQIENFTNSVVTTEAVAPKTNFDFSFQQNERKQMNLDGSSPDDSQEYFPMTTSMTRELRLELDSLNRQVFGSNFSTQFSTNNTCDTIDCPPDDECDTPESESHISNNKSPAVPSSEISYTKLNQTSTDLEDEQQLDKIYRCPSDKNLNGDVRLRTKLSVRHNEGNVSKRVSTSSVNTDVFVWENPLHQLSPMGTCITTAENDERIPFLNQEFVQTLTPDEQNDLEYDGEIIDENSGGKKSITPIRLLRKYGNDDIGLLSVQRSNASSKRNSSIYRNDSDSDSSSEMSTNDPERRLKRSQNTTVLKKSASVTVETNPFLMDMRSMTMSEQPRQNDNNNDSVTNSPVDEEATEANIVLRKVGTSSLPSPTQFGGGNPFLMFLCLTLLLQHRNYVMKNNMDYNEMAMHFDKMVRKHNVIRVLNQARRMYAEYLKSQNVIDPIGGETSRMSNSTIGECGGSRNASRLGDEASGENINLGSSNNFSIKQKF